MAKWVYSFGQDTEGNATMRELLGGKGANLAEMCGIGLPVPPGFTITTEVCTHFNDNNRAFPDDLAPAVEQAIACLEQETGLAFADPDRPLLQRQGTKKYESPPGYPNT